MATSALHPSRNRNFHHLRGRYLAREVPHGLIEQQHGMLGGADHGAGLGQVQVHRRGVAHRQDQGRALAVLRADRTENVDRGVALILRRRGPGPATYPAAGRALRRSSVSRGVGPGALRSSNPAGPSALKRTTQSRTIYKVTLPNRAASERVPPS